MPRESAWPSTITLVGRPPLQILGVLLQDAARFFASARPSRARRTRLQHAALVELVERRLGEDLVLGRRLAASARRRGRRRRRGGAGGVGRRRRPAAAAAERASPPASFPHALTITAQRRAAIATADRKLEIIPLSPRSKMVARRACGEPSNSLTHVFMDRLLEATARAERDHFWFHGFRRFVRAAARRGDARPSRRDDPRLRLRHRQQPPMLRRYGRACGIDITWSGLAYARARGERQVARASATCLPFPAGGSISSPRSTSSTRSTTRWSVTRSMRCIGCCGPEDRS